MPREEKKASFLTDLGRATMRGVRKCRKCGTLNGTRGLSCKNKSCDVIFKEAGEKKKASTEACKIKAGTTAQIYSVRVRDKGPDYRGFVQLPLIQSMDGTGDMFVAQETLGDPLLLCPAGARCYVEPCQRNVEKLMVQQPSVCSHIRAASQCYKEAQALLIKHSVLNSFPIPQSMKGEIWGLATDTTGPLVQRVSRSIMVVKCKPEPRHPLGFLHFSFQHGGRGRDDCEHKYYCNCRAFKIQPAARDDTYRKCVHLYACLVAFASDEQLSQEFSYYVDLIHSELPPPILQGTGHESDGDSSDRGGAGTTGTLGGPERSFLILNEGGDSQCQVEVEVLQDDSALLETIPISPGDEMVTQEELEGKLEIQLGTRDGIHIRTSDGETISVHQISDNLPVTGIKRRRDDSVVQASSALLTLQESGTKKVTSPKKPLTGACARKAREPLDENTASFSFLCWLSSVTERINQNMHFQFSGKPEPLIFHIPKIFFECLMERISYRSKRRPVPNQTQYFVRKDTVPLGKFTKYTWTLWNLLQVKRVFDTPEVPLELTRTFMQNRDGTYKVYKQPEEDQTFIKTSPNQPLIRPKEFTTVLKVGSPGHNPTPFIIDWIPDILPQSCIGELRIRFEFEHLHNGQIVNFKDERGQASSHGGSTSASFSTTSTVRTQGPLLAPRPPPQTQLTTSEQIISIPISDALQNNDNIATILTF
ncbi:uncharacterized protein C2orf42 isoform X2 [Oratosquilla oratoria]